MNRKYLSSRGLCYFDLEEFDKSLDDYKNAQRLGDESEKTYYQKYVCEFKLGYLYEAI